MTQDTKVSESELIMGQETYGLAPEAGITTPAFGHELVIGPGLQVILDSVLVDPPVRTKRVLCALALLVDPAGFSHERFSLLYFGHADPTRAETWNHVRSLQTDLNLRDFDVHSHGERFYLKGLRIVKRVPDLDLRTFLENCFGD